MEIVGDLLVGVAVGLLVKEIVMGELSYSGLQLGLQWSGCRCRWERISWEVHSALQRSSGEETFWPCRGKGLCAGVDAGVEISEFAEGEAGVTSHCRFVVGVVVVTIVVVRRRWCRRCCLLSFTSIVGCC